MVVCLGQADGRLRQRVEIGVLAGEHPGKLCVGLSVLSVGEQRTLLSYVTRARPAPQQRGDGGNVVSPGACCPLLMG